MAAKPRKAKKVPTLIRWTTTILVMGVYFALGLVYVIPGVGIWRLAALTGVKEASVTMGFGLRSLARMVTGNLTRNVFRTRMLCLGYCSVAVILSMSMASIPWINYIYVLLGMFCCHGICFGYVKNTSRMILRQLWAHRLPTFIKVRNYHFLAGAMLGPFFSFPPSPEPPQLPQMTYLMCLYQRVLVENGTSLLVHCYADPACNAAWTPQSPTVKPPTNNMTSLIPVNGLVVDSYTYCSRVESPETSFMESLTSFEVQYLLSGWVGLVTSLLAALSLYYFEKALAARQMKKKGLTPQTEDLTGTRLDMMPEIVRKPVKGALEKVGLMKYVPEYTKPEKTDHGSKLDYLPGPVRNLLEKTGVVKLGTEVSDRATEIKDKMAGEVSHVVERAETQLADQEQTLLKGQERPKQPVGDVAVSLLGIATSAIKRDHDVTDGKTDDVTDGKTDDVTDGQTDDVTDGQTDNVTDGQTDDVTDHFPSEIDDRQDTPIVPKQEDSSSDEDDDDLGEAMEDVFEIILAVIMAVIMGFSAIITYTNFIAKYLLTLGASQFESSAITSMFSVTAAIGNTVVVTLYKYFKLQKVLFLCTLVSTLTMGFLLGYGQHYLVVWCLTAVFGLFAGKVQEGIEDLADEHDLLSDEFEGVMDKAESLVLAVIPTVMGYLMAWEPKSLFYVTFGAFLACTAFLVYLPAAIGKFEFRKKQRLGLIEGHKDGDVELNVVPPEPDKCPHNDLQVYEHIKGHNLLKSKSFERLPSKRPKYYQWLE